MNIIELVNSFIENFNSFNSENRLKNKDLLINLKIFIL